MSWTIGAQYRVRLEFKQSVLEAMTPAERTRVEAWRATAEEVLQREADQTVVQHLGDGLFGLRIVRQPDVN